MIAIYDYDFFKCLLETGGLAPPNLAAMKLSYFFTFREPSKFELVSNLDEINKYDDIYFFSNKFFTEIPSEILTDKRIKCYGRYFKNKIDPIVNHMPPYISVYYSVVENLLDHASVEKLIDWMDAVYYQARIDGELMPLPPTEPRKPLILYDVDFLSYPDWEAILNKIQHAIAPSSIITTCPLICNKLSVFLNLRKNFPLVKKANKTYLDFHIPAEDLERYFEKYRIKLLSEITPSTSNTYVYLGKNYYNDNYDMEFFMDDFCYSLNLVCAYIKAGIPIKYKLWEAADNIQTNPCYYLYKGLVKWGNTKSKDMTLKKACGATKKDSDVSKAIQDFIEYQPQYGWIFNCAKQGLPGDKPSWKIIPKTE